MNADRPDLPQEWEVTRILDSRITARGRQQYLLRWEGYGAQADRWTNVEDINADELIEEYEAHRAQIPVRVTRRQEATQRRNERTARARNQTVRSNDSQPRRRPRRPRKNPT